MASPETTLPSKGIILPVRTMIWVPRPTSFTLRRTLLALGQAPDLVHVQGHGSRQIGHGLFMGPVLQKLAQMEHEHDTACRIKVAPDQRYGDGGGIQHGHGQLPAEQGFQPGGHIGNGPPHRQHRPDGQGQEQQ